MTTDAPPEKMLLDELVKALQSITCYNVQQAEAIGREAARRLAPRMGDAAQDRCGHCGKWFNWELMTLNADGSWCPECVAKWNPSAPPAASADAEARCLICGAIDGHRQPCTAFMPIGPTAASAERETMAAREGWFRAATFYVDLNAESDPAVVAEADKRWPLSALPKGQEHEG